MVPLADGLVHGRCCTPCAGKTLLAKAVAGEAGVPFFSAAGTEFMEARTASLIPGLACALSWFRFLHAGLMSVRRSYAQLHACAGSPANTPRQPGAASCQNSPYEALSLVM